mmetsp:Transcript_73857/g.198283  ORF Transcript_73857/g.198283 Transcript_73857/m.198283 type:complete len:249 (-) Transcript_73857:104-850(-)
MAATRRHGGHCGAEAGRVRDPEASRVRDDLARQLRIPLRAAALATRLRDAHGAEASQIRTALTQQLRIPLQAEARQVRAALATRFRDAREAKNGQVRAATRTHDAWLHVRQVCAAQWRTEGIHQSWHLRVHLPLRYHGGQIGHEQPARADGTRVRPLRLQLGRRGCHLHSWQRARAARASRPPLAGGLAERAREHPPVRRLRPALRQNAGWVLSGRCARAPRAFRPPLGEALVGVASAEESLRERHGP